MNDPAAFFKAETTGRDTDPDNRGSGGRGFSFVSNADDVQAVPLDVHEFQELENLNA